VDELSRPLLPPSLALIWWGRLPRRPDNLIRDTVERFLTAWLVRLKSSAPLPAFRQDRLSATKTEYAALTHVPTHSRRFFLCLSGKGGVKNANVRLTGSKQVNTE
jgi:hypothetical protein